jgi:hypothetical protein
MVLVNVHATRNARRQGGEELRSPDEEMDGCVCDGCRGVNVNVLVCVL